MDSQKLKMNNRGMLARDYVIVLIIFSVIAGIGALIVADMASSDNGYGVANMSDPTFDSAYNKISNTTSLVGEMGNETTSNEGLGFLGTTELFFGSTITVVQLMFNSLSMVNGIFSSMVQTFGIPTAIANIIFPALLSILTTILVFVVISSLTKSKM
jgi:hypothetical protein